MAYYRIREWAQYQHYKDRDPPWIKLHRETLTSRTWVTLDNDGRALAIACMLVAAGTENKIPADPQYMMRRAYFNAVPDFAPLVGVGFIELVGDIRDLDVPALAPASTPQASATKRTSETEAKQRRAEKKDNSAAAKPGADKRGTRLTDDFQLTPELRAFASDHGLEPDGLRDEFVDFWTSVPGSKGLKLDWSKTFKNRCRELSGRTKRGAGKPAFKSYAQQREEAASALPPAEPWEQRLRAYRKSGFWQGSTWGPEPGHAGCRVPSALVNNA